MKTLTRLLFAPLILSLIGCGADTPEPQTNIDVTTDKVSVSDGMIVGNDRDGHGCIASAGYVWSESMAECVRLFEVGIALENMQGMDSTSSAYLIANSSDHLELFTLAGKPIQLYKNAPDVWRDTDQIYTVKLGSPAYYTVFKDGQTLFFEDRYVANPLNAEEYESLNGAYADDVLTETGILIRVEDGAYPFYSMTMEFPKRDMRASFTLNAESVPVDIAALYARLDTMISIEYVSETIMNVVEIQLESGFLNGTKNRATLRDYTSASGIMGGASVTMGDLPGTFYLEDAENNRTYFEDYITAEMVAGNGRQVTVYYSERYQNMITGIDLSDK